MNASRRSSRSAPAPRRREAARHALPGPCASWASGTAPRTSCRSAAGMNPANMLMAQVCKQAILCEHLRSEVWAGKLLTRWCLGEPERVASRDDPGLGDVGHGPARRPPPSCEAKAFEAAPAVAGSIVVGEDSPSPSPSSGIAGRRRAAGPDPRGGGGRQVLLDPVGADRADARRQAQRPARHGLAPRAVRLDRGRPVRGPDPRRYPGLGGPSSSTRPSAWAARPSSSTRAASEPPRRPAPASPPTSASSACWRSLGALGEGEH